MSSAIAELVELGDLDELTRMIDRLCGAGDWDGLVELRDRCRAALQRGRQLWPAADLAEYRAALQAPGAWAGPMLRTGTGRFALGPLSEVAASTHRWDELAPHAPAGPVATMCAHERVVRGEDLRDRDGIDPTVLDLPLALQPWEPAYPLAEYEPDSAHFPSLPLPPLRPRSVSAATGVIEDRETCDALVELAVAWTTESNGRAQAVAVAGDAGAAVAALGPRTVRIAEVSPADALARLAWTGASGGAHGRRRGMSAGRFAAWWALAAMSGLLECWPVPAADLGRAAAEIRWYVWDVGEPMTGWSLRLAAEDPDEGTAWAVSAGDAV